MKVVDKTGKAYGRLTALRRGNGCKRKYATAVTWICQCSCGNNIEVAAGDLGTRVNSCGCLRKEKTSERAKVINKGKVAHNRMPPGIAALRHVYGYYKMGAEKRELEFLLTVDEFERLIRQNCIYCGMEPSNITVSHPTTGVLQWNGVDRKDSSKGYVLDNCQSCCTNCNRMKLDLTEEEFLNHIKRLARFQWRDQWTEKSSINVE